VLCSNGLYQLRGSTLLEDAEDSLVFRMTRFRVGFVRWVKLILIFGISEKLG
jgi:hypothetical protein